MTRELEKNECKCEIQSQFVIKGEQKNYIVIFWKDFILLVENDLDQYSIVGQKQVEKKIIWGGIIANRAIAVLYDDFIIRIESVESLFVSLGLSAGFGDACSLNREILAFRNANTYL